MTLKEKFNSIDQSRITADQKAFLDKMKNVTKDFTLENKEVNDKVEGALDKMITSFKEKMPDAIKTSTKVVVPKSKRATFEVGQTISYPITKSTKLDKSVKNLINKYAEKELVIEKINIDKPYNTAKVYVKSTGEKVIGDVTLNPRVVKTYNDGKKENETTKVVSKTTTPKRTVMSVAKEIRKEGESWKDAQKRASDIIKEDKAEVSEVVKKELDRINKFINSRAELKGISGTNIKRDAVRTAKPRGERTVTKSGETSNQYGTFSNKLGRRYWESRDRHADRLAPNYPKDAPLLADGGYLTDPTFGNFQNQVFAGGGGVNKKLESGVYRVGKPIKVSNNFYEQKIVEIFENGDIATASDYGRKLGDFKSQKYPIISKEQLDAQYKYELGGVMATDLAGHTGGGTGGLNAGMPLDGFSNTGYDGLTGETGAMSSGEMFMNGGSIGSDSWYDKHYDKKSLDYVAGEIAHTEKSRRQFKLEGDEEMAKDRDEHAKKLWEIYYKKRKESKKLELGGGLPAGAEQSYVNYYLGEGSAQPIYELGGTVVTDLAGHTGGSLGTGDPSMLDGFSNTGYTGLVGETGAMSSGEMFMAGGTLPEGSSQSYMITESLGNPAQHFAFGGAIKNQYKGRTPEDIWNNLSSQQRGHFLYDHVSEIEEYKNIERLPTSEIRKAYNSDWLSLDKDIKNRFANHTREGQYKAGGMLDANERYVLEIKGLTGLRKEAIENYIAENNLSDNDVLNIVIGLGRKQLKGSDVASAVVGKKGNALSKKVIEFAKDNKGMKLEEGGNIDAFTLRMVKGTAGKPDEAMAEPRSVQFAEGGGVSQKEKREAYLDNLIMLESEVWDEIGANSGGQIRGNKKLLRKYAEGVGSIMEKEGVGYGSFDQEDYDYFTDENNHLFNEFLVWNNYYEPSVSKPEQKWRLEYSKNPKKAEYVSDPEVITLNSTKSKSETGKDYIVHADIVSVTVKKAGKEVTYSGKDVLNGANVLADGGGIEDKASYFSKNNVVSVELKNGKSIKPANGYWVDKDATPIKKMETGGGVDNFSEYSNDALYDMMINLSRYENTESEIKMIKDELEKRKGKNLTIEEEVVYEKKSKKMATGGGFEKLSKSVAKKYEGKRVKPAYEKEYGKVYSKKEAKEVGDKVAGKVKANQKMNTGGATKKGGKGGIMLLAKQIRKDGEKWTDAVKRAGKQLK